MKQPTSPSRPSNKQGAAEGYKQSRINFEWINPALFGIEIEVEVDKKKAKVGREVKVSIKSQFIKFASIIAQKLNISYIDIIRAFIGESYHKVVGRGMRRSSQSTLYD